LLDADSKSDISKNMSDWNHFKITHTIPEQQTRKAQNEGTTKAAILGTAHKLQ